MTTARTAIRSLKWSLLAEAASKTIGPLAFLVLAQLLVPEDFGVVAAATVVFSFSQVFWDAGLSKALVQDQSSLEDSANVVFWTNCGLAAFMAVALITCAPFVAHFFHDPRITAVVRIQSLLIPLAAAASVHTALLQKQFQFRKLFWTRLLTVTLPHVASIPLAISGMGYWALVTGALIGQFAQTFSLWILSSWRPRMTFDFGRARALSRFGGWAMASALLAWFYGWMDAVIVGHWLGAHEMGLYRSGNTFVTLIFGLLFTPLLPVLYSAFSAVQTDLPRIRNQVMFVANAIALVSLPAAALLWFSQEIVEQTFFADSWAGIGLVIGILGIAHGFAWIVGAGGEAYRAVGKPNVETYVMGSVAIVYLVGYLVSVRHGLAAFLVTRAVLAVISLVPHIWASSRCLGIPAWTWIPTLFKGLLVSIVIVALQRSLTPLSPSLASWLVNFGVTAVTYAAVIVIVDRHFVIKATKLFLR